MSAQPNKAGAASTNRGGSTLLPLALALFVMLSALAVIQIKHRHRTLTTQLEQLRTERERLELEWAQLQLEEATLAQHSRVDTLARTQFDMIDPRDYRIVDASGAASTPLTTSPTVAVAPAAKSKVTP
ncbi:MAG: hypothetical protein NVS9B10_00420 [Nevskia sp.]